MVNLELERAGFGEFVTLCNGPLIRPTHGSLGFSHMPMSPESTYDTLGELFEEAFAASNNESADMELDLQGHATPLWGHHSFRRFADTCARETMRTTGATEQDIDIIFGWMEAFYSQKMQNLYESRFTREVRCRVTSLV